MGKYSAILRHLGAGFFCLLLLSQRSEAQQNISLAQALELARTHNKKLKSAQWDIEAAKAVREGINGADKPMIDGSVMGFYVGKPLNSLLPEYGVSPSVIVKQSIYAGGKIKLGKQAADKGIEIYQEQKVLAESEVIFNVQKAYWQVASISEKIVLAKTFKSLLESLLKQLTNSFDAGMIYKNDILRVQVQLNEAELNLVKAKDGLVMSKLNLAQQMGMPGNTEITLADSIVGTFNILAADSYLTAAENRSEIRLLKRALEAQRIQEKLLKADFKPTVGLLASGFASIGPNMNFENGNNLLSSYLGLVSVSIPIWDWGQKASKVKEQSFKVRANQVQMEETREMISLEAQNAYLLLNQAAKRIDLSQVSVQQANENLRLNNDRFSSGTVTGQDVLEAQTLWQQANSNVIDAKVEYKISEAAYQKAIGHNQQ
ncbi:TolC family protein [Dyadobacter subterraneus]|uniref:TolC family protein n=1 Tax=Dyadobacter subterraneus TaxID=2773304 RepID=A0ABR9W9J1_9BACT|nr:TolC family protein [Dyadobacter subterraneus]MBE9462107.1 TolC family protein [Dyadobacter subterraneus]